MVYGCMHSNIVRVYTYYLMQGNLLTLHRQFWLLLPHQKQLWQLHKNPDLQVRELNWTFQTHSVHLKLLYVVNDAAIIGGVLATMVVILSLIISISLLVYNWYNNGSGTGDQLPSSAQSPSTLMSSMPLDNFRLHIH